MERIPNTTKLRILYAILFAIVILGGLVGWFFGHDPNELMSFIGTLGVAMVIGEASNIAKRVTFKTDIAKYHKTEN